MHIISYSHEIQRQFKSLTYKKEKTLKILNSIYACFTNLFIHLIQINSISKGKWSRYALKSYEIFIFVAFK